MSRTALSALVLLTFAFAAQAAPEKRVYRVDSVIATMAGATVTVQVRGAVEGGGWNHPRLRLVHGDGHTLVVEFLAQAPANGAAVITGLLPVTAKTTIKAGRSAVTVKAMAEANEVTTQILH